MEKEKALKAALAQIEKQFGKGALMKLGDSPTDNNIQVIPTGCNGDRYCAWDRWNTTRTNN